MVREKTEQFSAKRALSYKSGIAATKAYNPSILFRLVLLESRMTTLSVSVRERHDRSGVPGGPEEAVTVAVIGELDIATTARFTARMGEVLRRGQLTELVLDLSGLSFIDAGGLRALTDLRSRVEQRNAVLVLDHVPPQMRRLMRIIGPSRRFRMR